MFTPVHPFSRMFTRLKDPDLHQQRFNYADLDASSSDDMSEYDPAADSDRDSEISESDRPVPLISPLPNEIWAHIFRFIWTPFHLSQVALVCRTFHRIIGTHTMFRVRCPSWVLPAQGEVPALTDWKFWRRAYNRAYKSCCECGCRNSKQLFFCLVDKEWFYVCKENPGKKCFENLFRWFMRRTKSQRFLQNGIWEDDIEEETADEQDEEVAELIHLGWQDLTEYAEMANWEYETVEEDEEGEDMEEQDEDKVEMEHDMYEDEYHKLSNAVSLSQSAIGREYGHSVMVYAKQVLKFQRSFWIRRYPRKRLPVFLYQRREVELLTVFLRGTLEGYSKNSETSQLKAQKEVILMLKRRGEVRKEIEDRGLPFLVTFAHEPMRAYIEFGEGSAHEAIESYLPVFSQAMEQNYSTPKERSLKRLKRMQ